MKLRLMILLFSFSFAAYGQVPSPQPTRTQTPIPTIDTNNQNDPSVIADKIKLESEFADKQFPVKIPQFDTAPVIDGRLADEVWKRAARLGEFRQTYPNDKVEASLPTEVMLGYDSKNLYLAFRAVQRRETIRATVARRDQIFNDDYVGVHLDTFNDQRQAYALYFNPLGIQADGTLVEERGEDTLLDIVMESKGVLTDDGYTVEVAIPFKSLRYEAGKNKLWGVHFYRRIKYNNNELDSWLPIPRGRAMRLDIAGHLTGLEDISTTRQLEIIPSLTVSESGRRTRYSFDGNPAGRYVNDGVKGDFGLTAKFGLTPTITLDFAYNPDFAQVEADAPVSTANQRFPIFFAEKRPFFLERIDIFQTSLNVVNTRAIVDPDVAVKLTGRRGRNTFGLLYASDNAPGNYSVDERQDLLECLKRRVQDSSVLCNNEKFIDKNADIGVFRLKRDIGRRHNLGVFATTYNFVERHNNTAGFDGRFRLDPKTVMNFQVVGTNSRRFFYDPDLDKSVNRTGNGFGYHAWLERSDRNLYMNYLAYGRTNYYRADVGFTPRTNTNYIGSFIKYETERHPKERIIFKRVFNESNANYDWQARLQQWKSNTQVMIALQRQTFVGMGLEFGYERVFEYEFGRNRTAARTGTFFGADSERSAYNKEIYGFIETTPSKKIFAFAVLSYTFGRLEYDTGNGPRFPRVSTAALSGSSLLDPGAGNQFYAESTVRYQPTAAFQTQLNFTKTRLVRNDTQRVAFDDNIVSSRSVYQFTRNTFARFRLDYSTLAARFRPQFVLGWTPNPGTAFYAGYNDDLNYNGFNPYTRVSEPGFRGNGRTFFIKAAYLFKKSF